MVRGWNQVGLTTKTLMGAVLVIGGLGLGLLGTAKTISIVYPQPEENLYFGETLEIAVSGLYANLVPRIDIVIWAKNKEGMFPITKYAGSSYVPLVEEFGAEVDTPAKLVWTNKQAGQGRVIVKWNWLPVGFSDGDYEIKVQFFEKITEHAAVIWAETPWQSNKLITRQWIEITSPPPGAQFYCGDQIEIKGIVLNLRPPVNIFLEISKTLWDWEVVDQKEIAENRFVFFWNTESQSPGEYWFRVRAVGESEHVLLGDRRNVVLRSRPSPPKIVVYGKRFVGVDLRFVIEGEDQWASFRWDFGDRTLSVEKSPTHKYLKAGEYRVVLTVYSEPELKGISLSAEMTLVVKERIAIQRTILGYPGFDPSQKYAFHEQEVEVKLEIKVLYPVDAFTIREEVPIGYVAKLKEWQYNPRDVQIKGLPMFLNERTLQWVFHQAPEASSQLPADLTITIFYFASPNRLTTKTFPELEKFDGSASVSMEGIVRNIKVEGENAFYIVDSLPLCVVIAFLEKTSDGEWKLKTPGEKDAFITEENISYARHFLQTGELVPYTNQTMSIEAYLKLYAMFLYKIPVTHCSQSP
jgi:hypothetical protein